jgi:hypothetical protein
VGVPALKALTCLEANNATAADVYILWHAFLQSTKAVLEDHNQYIPQDTQDQITGTLNRRHKLAFEDGQISTAAELYPTATYLHPSMY